MKIAQLWPPLFKTQETQGIFTHRGTTSKNIFRYVSEEESQPAIPTDRERERLDDEYDREELELGGGGVCVNLKKRKEKEKKRKERICIKGVDWSLVPEALL